MRTPESIIKIPDFRYFNIDEGNHYSDYTSISEENEYIPINSLSHGDLYESNGKRIFIYQLVVPFDGDITVRRITGFCDYMMGRGSYINYWVKLKHLTVINRTYLASAGTIVYRDDVLGKFIPLMVVAVRREFLFSINRQNPDISQFVLLIDKSFYNDAEHYKLYRSVLKYYENIISKDIDVLYSNDIMRLCYNPGKPIELPKFKSVIEMKASFASINSLVEQSIRE